MEVQGRQIKFKLDTGADVSIISKVEYNQLNPKPKLKQTKAKLNSPGGKLSCVGEFDAPTTFKGNDCVLRIFVIYSSTDNLLSRDAVTKLGLIQRVNSIKSVFGDVTDT